MVRCLNKWKLDPPPSSPCGFVCAKADRAGLPAHRFSLRLAREEGTPFHA